MKFDQKEAFLYETYSRVEGVVGSDRATQVYAELSEHIDQLHEEYIERGLQPELAKRAALGAMGTPRSIATEFARTSISKPWRTWPLLVVILGVICYVILKDSPASGNYIESLYLVVPILFVGGFRNRVSLPFKPLLLGALLVGGCLCFIEARSVRFWAERIPYPSAHSMFNDMQTQHAQALEMESKVAQNLKSISNTLLTQVDQANYSRGRVNLEAITYRNNPYGYYAPRQVGANRFLHVPVLATKQYSFVDAQEVISAKLGTIAVRQSERRNLMRWLGTLLNTSSFDRLASGMPYIVSAIVLVFGVSYLMSLLGAKVGIAAVTRRRRILS